MNVLVVERMAPPIEELKAILGIEDFHDDVLLHNAVRHRSMNQMTGTGAPHPTVPDATAPDVPNANCSEVPDEEDKEKKFLKAGTSDYEKQEFLGDAVMDFCIAYDMYKCWCLRQEKNLCEPTAAKLIKSAAPTVKNETLFHVMKAKGLDKFVQVCQRDRQGGGSRLFFHFQYGSPLQDSGFWPVCC